jgi:hypothetical protein
MPLPGAPGAGPLLPAMLLPGVPGAEALEAGAPEPDRPAPTRVVGGTTSCVGPSCPATLGCRPPRGMTPRGAAGASPAGSKRIATSPRGPSHAPIGPVRAMLVMRSPATQMSLPGSAVSCQASPSDASRAW